MEILGAGASLQDFLKLYAAKGTVNGELDLNVLVNELSTAENGAVVVSLVHRQSGQPGERRMAKWRVPKAIVEGLDGKADLLHNGKITITSLETYVDERVKERTKSLTHDKSSSGDCKASPVLLGRA